MGYDGVFSIILEANADDSQFSCTGSVVQCVGPHSTDVSSVVMYTRIVPGALGGTGGASPVQSDISYSACQ